LSPFTPLLRFRKEEERDKSELIYIYFVVFNKQKINCLSRIKNLIFFLFKNCVTVNSR